MAIDATFNLIVWSEFIAQYKGYWILKARLWSLTKKNNRWKINKWLHYENILFRFQHLIRRLFLQYIVILKKIKWFHETFWVWFTNYVKLENNMKVIFSVLNSRHLTFHLISLVFYQIFVYFINFKVYLHHTSLSRTYFQYMLSLTVTHYAYMSFILIGIMLKLSAQLSSIFLFTNK